MNSSSDFSDSSDVYVPQDSEKSSSDASPEIKRRKYNTRKRRHSVVELSGTYSNSQSEDNLQEDSEEADNLRDADSNDDISVTVSLDYSDSNSQVSDDKVTHASDDETLQNFDINDSSDHEDEWDTHEGTIPNFNFDTNRTGIIIDPGETPIKIFNSMWTKNVIDIILVSTNNYMHILESSTRPHQKHTRIQKYKEVDEMELNNFLGICMLSGQRRYPSTRKMFSRDALYYSPVFKYVMTGRRFEQILRCFNCELIPTVCCEKPDRLATMFYPSEQLSLDESLLLFRGRLSFRQYMKGKKSKYGIKLFELTTPDGYVLNINVYTGKSEKSEAGSKTLKIVKNLAELYLDKGHHIYLDNFYNSIELSEYLLNRKTHSTGTLKKESKR